MLNSLLMDKAQPFIMILEKMAGGYIKYTYIRISIVTRQLLMMVLIHVCLTKILVLVLLLRD